ncbi:MAG: (Fe-S)-binding protein [Desulfonauticus sp.]|nr:(Fe-S)-binding protein [Desulfonauticus sp.]
MKQRKLIELVCLLKQLDDDLIKCMKCGMCQAVCPLYKTSFMEPDVARGKLVLISHLVNELISSPEKVSKIVNKCLLCGSCAANCPSGVDVVKIFLKTRVIIAKFFKLSFVERLILRDIVAKPRLFEAIFNIAARTQKLFVQEQNPTLGSASCKIPFLTMLKDRHFVPPKKNTFHKQMAQKQSISEKNKIGIFAGCLVDKFFPEIGLSIVKILDELEMGYLVPDTQICCGIPAISSGDLQSFKSMVAQLINLYPVDELDYIVTPCASCTSTLKKIWPMFLKEFNEQQQEKILSISAKVMDISEFLIQKTNVAKKFKTHINSEQKIKITYHDPCHLKKSLNIYKEPRQIIKLNSRYELVEMQDSDACCGMGGSFNLKHYEISKEIGLKKLENIIKTEAKVIATSCPACMLQLIDMLSHRNVDIMVRHPIQILQEEKSCGPHRKI